MWYSFSQLVKHFVLCFLTLSCSDDQTCFISSSGRIYNQSSTNWYNRPCCPHLHPNRVMTEEAADFSSGQDSARVRILVTGHHLYSKRLQLGRIQGPNEEEIDSLNSCINKIIMQQNLSSAREKCFSNIKQVATSNTYCQKNKVWNKD